MTRVDLTRMEETGQGMQVRESAHVGAEGGAMHSSDTRGRKLLELTMKSTNRCSISIDWLGIGAFEQNQDELWGWGSLEDRK